jgi:hypothetical protein
MNMPGFTAGASLNGVSQRYRRAGSAVAFAGGEGVVPQATAVPDWIIDFWNATGGGGGLGGIGGGGGGLFSSQTCLAKAKQRYDECWFGCNNDFGGPGGDLVKARPCYADCRSRYIAATNNCLGVYTV